MSSNLAIGVAVAGKIKITCKYQGFMFKAW